MMITNIFRRQLKKSTDFQSEVIERLDCIQKSQATSKQDIRQIVREEIKSILNERNRKGWWQVA